MVKVDGLTLMCGIAFVRASRTLFCDDSYVSSHVKGYDTILSDGSPDTLEIRRCLHSADVRWLSPCYDLRD